MKKWNRPAALALVASLLVPMGMFASQQADRTVVVSGHEADTLFGAASGCGKGVNDVTSGCNGAGCTSRFNIKIVTGTGWKTANATCAYILFGTIYGCGGLTVGVTCNN